MLIDSGRFKPGDAEAWERLSRYDVRLAASPRLSDLTDRAVQVISAFAPDYVSVSWGKDSTVVAHLAVQSGYRGPFVWVRVDQWENPDCVLVRDAFLARYDVEYHEYVVDASAPRWWEDGAEDQAPSRRTSRSGFELAESVHGRRRVSGVRAQESRHRRIAMGRWGETGPYAARPIGWWDATDVFAYLAAHDLPVHPAYAQSFGGRLDRQWIRVGSLGGVRGADRGRSEWEIAYYPDVFRRYREKEVE